jgi:ribosomal protein S18 acetylase RimI-like enzyme
VALTIRLASAVDVPLIERIVHDSYAPYIPRMGKLPGPMRDDYRARVEEQVVWALEDDGKLIAIAVLVEKPDHMLLDNLAVMPSHRSRGMGRKLIAFAESEAQKRGHREIRLYTHVTMTENQALYRRLGFEETHRAGQAGFERVFMRKQL